MLLVTGVNMLPADTTSKDLTSYRSQFLSPQASELDDRVSDGFVVNRERKVFLHSKLNSVSESS